MHLVISRGSFHAVIRELSRTIARSSQARSSAVQIRLEAKEIIQASRTLRREQVQLRDQGRPSGNRAA